jgi:hypothetical protein
MIYTIKQSIASLLEFEKFFALVLTRHFYIENNRAGRKPLVHRTAGNFPVIFISVTGKENSGEGDLFSPAVYYRFPKDFEMKEGISHEHHYRHRPRL